MDMLNNVEGKKVKEDIIEMIYGIGVNELSLLQEIESAIINIHADYYYTMLAADAFL
jgi:hypothetical protein